MSMRNKNSIVWFFASALPAYGVPFETAVTLFPVQYDAMGLSGPGNDATISAFTVDDTVTEVSVLLTASRAGVSANIECPDSGPIIAPGTIAGLGGQYIANHGGESAPGFHQHFMFPAQGIGVYRINLSASGLQSDERIAVMITVMTNSSVGANLFVSEPVIPLGYAVVTYVLLFDGGTPLPIARVGNVSADLWRPGEAVESVSLTFRDDGQYEDAIAGDGLYTAYYYVPNEVGDYTIIGDISGTTSGNASFRLSPSASFTVVDKCATIGSGHTWTPVDDDGNGLFDRLVFNVQVDVAIGGKVEARVTMETPVLEKVYGSGEATLTTGPGVVQVSFDASTIQEINQDGHHSVTAIEVLCQGTDVVASSDRVLVNPPIIYWLDVDGFEPPPLRLTGNNGTNGKDTDGDGDYDELGLIIGIQAAVEGERSYTATLVEATCGTQIEVINGTAHLWNSGESYLYLPFNGSLIGASGMNGPYMVRSLSVWDDDAALNATNVYETGAHEASLFDSYTPAPDCNANGVVDACDVATGESQDCNFNGIPDSCDLGPSGSSTDFNENGRPDDCDPLPQTPRTAPYPHERRKNRYISFDPNNLLNDGIDVAFMVELKSITLGSCDDGTGEKVDFCRVDRVAADCNSCAGGLGGSCITTAIHCSTGGGICTPTGALCVNDKPNTGSTNVGQVWWVGPEHPSGNSVHLLVSEAFRKVSTSWPNPTHVGDCEIVPGAVYGVRAVEATSSLGDSERISGEMLVETTKFTPVSGNDPFWWGDAIGALAHYCNGDIRLPTCTVPTQVADCGAGVPCQRAWTMPNGATNFDDVNAALTLVAPPGVGVPALPTWVDLHGGGADAPPNFMINASDLQNFIFAFAGYPYEGYDPKDCPDEPAWGSREGPTPGPLDPEFTLVASDDLLDPTQELQIEVYVSEAAHVSGHELALEVSGGSAGTLIVSDITIDDQRSDYIYYEYLTMDPAPPAPVEVRHLTEKRSGQVIQSIGASVTRTGAVYLGTFTLLPTGGATGVFQIDVAGQGKSFLLNPDGSTQAVNTSGTAVVGYGVDCLSDGYCDDNNECTTDSCSGSYECQFTPVASGTACDDGLWCTVGGSTCDGNGLCTGGNPRCQSGELCVEATHTCQPDLPPMEE